MEKAAENGNSKGKIRATPIAVWRRGLEACWSDLCWVIICSQYGSFGGEAQAASFELKKRPLISRECITASLTIAGQLQNTGLQPRCLIAMKVTPKA